MEATRALNVKSRNAHCQAVQPIAAMFLILTFVSLSFLIWQGPKHCIHPKRQLWMPSTEHSAWCFRHSVWVTVIITVFSFSGESTEAWRGEVPFPVSHSELVGPLCCCLPCSPLFSSLAISTLPILYSRLPTPLMTLFLPFCGPSGQCRPSCSSIYLAQPPF